MNSGPKFLDQRFFLEQNNFKVDEDENDDAGGHDEAFLLLGQLQLIAGVHVCAGVELEWLRTWSKKLKSIGLFKTLKLIDIRCAIEIEPCRNLDNLY